MPVPLRARLLAPLLLLTAALPLQGEPYAVSLREGDLAPGRVVLTESGRVFLEVSPRPGEGYAALARRVTGRADHWRAIQRANGGGTTIYTSRRYRVPLELLPVQARLEALAELWPGDRAGTEGWVHTVRGEKRFGRSESLWQVAQLFTGDGKRWPEIKKTNRLRGTALRVGQELTIPAGLLRPEYQLGDEDLVVHDGQEQEPAGEVRDTTTYRVDEAFVYGELEYDQDEEGPVAIYRLGSGEALYSAVVVRFTGRVDAEEVNRTAEVLARRSGIADVTDIPVGFPVKIPLALLTPDYLPPDHPRRIAYEEELAEGRSIAARLSRTSNLRGVTVILDAGHGGIDIGASNHSVWEDDYVYDIMVRVKRLLELGTEATVITTIRDQSQGDRPHDGRFTGQDHDEVILTTPNFHHTNAKLTAVNVHLRWYVSSYHYRQARKRGVTPDRVVFTSFHADSLHPSVRGSMVYVPGRDYRQTRYGKTGSLYMRYREVRDQPTVQFSRHDLARSEGLSRALSDSLVEVLKARKIGVHPHKPVRNHVIRRGRKWVPAVLRYNQVPTSLLVEVCNLNNNEDRELLRDPTFRQRFAESYVEALARHFEGR